MFGQKQYDTGIPIYLQIMQRIRQKIVSGEWSTGERMPAVRDLALEFGVNPNTMQRSLSELEREFLVYSERTSGRFITREKDIIDAARDAMARELMEAFFRQMEQMGYSSEQILQLLQTAMTHRTANTEEETT